MDPSYSVLLGNGKEDNCASDSKHGNSINSVALIASFATIVGLAILGTAAYFLVWPQVKLAMQLKSAQSQTELQSIRSSKSVDSINHADQQQKQTKKKRKLWRSNNNNNSGNQLNDSIEIERAPSMEVNTASGRFIVQL